MRSIRIRLRDRGRKLHWFIAIRSDRQNFTNSREEFYTTGLHEISNQRESQEADPFVVDSRGRTFLFFEEVPNATDRGHISCREITDGSSVSAPTRIIARPYHLSYPFVLFDGADFFMLPESSANATVELYRAVNFPYEWRLEQVLQNEVGLVDTTPFFHNGTWYFFTTAAETGEALLYYSDRLSGEWRYHRSNPICSDVQRARGAGEGSIRQRPSTGLWEARVSLEDGGRKSYYGKTRKEVADKLKAALKQQEGGVDLSAAATCGSGQLEISTKPCVEFAPGPAVLPLAHPQCKHHPSAQLLPIRHYARESHWLRIRSNQIWALTAFAADAYQDIRSACKSSWRDYQHKPYPQAMSEKLQNQRQQSCVVRLQRQEE